MKSQKAKGTQGERELVRAFNEAGWGCIRTAGSGSSRYPAPDLLAANAVRRVAVECKVTKEKRKYFPPEEVEQLTLFARTFGAEGWIAIKFPKEPWHFLLPEDLEKTGSNYGASLELVQRRGVTLPELLGEGKRNI